MDKKPEEKDIPQSDSQSLETEESKEQSTTTLDQSGSSAEESNEQSTPELVHEEKKAEESSYSEEEEDSDSLGPLFIGAIIVAIVGIAAAWFYVNQNNQATIPEQITQNPIEQFDVAQGEPTDVVIVVNETSLTRASLNRVLQQTIARAQSQGVDPTDPEIRDTIIQQSVDSLVNTELVRQAAEREGFDVTQEEVDTRYNDVVANTGGLEEFEAAIAEFGLTEEGIRQDVANELKIEAYINSILEPQIDVTEEDIQAFYDMVRGQAGEQGDEADFPPLDEVREQVRAQLAGQQEQEIIERLIEELRESADIDTQVL